MAVASVISSNTAVDLAVLGLLAERPRSLHQLIDCIKLVGGDRFTPTCAFIEARVASLIDAGCVEPQAGGDRLSATPGGTAHLLRLLRLEIDPGSATLRTFCTTLKFCLLDLVGADCRREVAAALVAAGRRRVDRLELEAWASGACPMTERYLALEQRREALELRWMEEVMPSEGRGATIA
ncbi:MAG: hypothetical protein ACREH3_15230 [Geminicoccales bacterium]